MASGAKQIFQVQVRQLVEFAWRRGNLGGEREFVGPRRALAGIRGHQKIQRSRPEGYRKEVAVSLEVNDPSLTLKIQGRIDGLLATEGSLLIEEIKTIQGTGEAQPDPLYWAQASIYAALILGDYPCEQVTLQVTLLNLDTGDLAEFRQIRTATELKRFLEETTTVYLEWMREQVQWRQVRDKSILQLDFPFPEYRKGQRRLAVAAYRAIAAGRRLFLEAPTGLGKTVSVIFPAVKALGEGHIEKVFYLTARTTAQAVAEKAFADLRSTGLRLRILTLTAKEKICVREGKPCEPQACPLAQGYYDRLRPALRLAVAQETLTRSVIEEIGRRHQLCPFEFSLDLSLWVDAVICDYNYVFDPRVYLRRHFGDSPAEYAFLIDEAHNLVDRAREMFSANLESQEVRRVRRMIKDTLPRCGRALSKVSSAMRKCARHNDEGCDAEGREEENLSLNLSAAPGTKSGTVTTLSTPESNMRVKDAAILRELPEGLIDALDTALEEMESWLARNEPAESRQEVLELYFRLFSFRRTAELFDERFVTIAEDGQFASVRLFCLDPAFLLAQVLRRGKAAVFFSATLAPLDYYRELLGGTAEDSSIQLLSPFPAEHLAVLVHDRIRTQFRSRSETLRAAAEAIASVVRARPGNYIAYFPSYAYLSAVQQELVGAYPGMRILVQKPGMTDKEREEFLAGFSDPLRAPCGDASACQMAGETAEGLRHPPSNPAAQDTNTLLGFAVLGGVFGEGIDLVGERLIGAIIVGVGLPQLCVERDLIRDYFHARNGAGFDYAYTFPGMNRVLQAIGRVIRSETDRGVVLLVDTRYSERRYMRLFPPHWRPSRVRSDAEIQRLLGAFWKPIRA